VISNLLLVSDLKGEIEDPGYYFGDTTRLSHLDLLMLTHGWSRFDVGEVLSGRLPETPFYLERGQVISGVIENYNPEHGVKDRKAVITREQQSAEMIFKKYYQGNNLYADLIAFRKENGYPNPDEKPSDEKRQGSLMLVSDKGHFQICLPDSAGRFHVDLAFLDSTTFKIGFANLKVKQRAYLKINVDREEFLPTRNLFLARQEIQEEEEVRNREHALRYFIENGEKVYLLDEVTVKKKMPQKFYSIHDHLAEKYNRFDSAQIANMEGETLLDVIKKLPSVMVIGNDIYPAGTSPDKKVLVFVNGFPEQPVWLSWYPRKYLLSVNYMDAGYQKIGMVNTIMDPYKENPLYEEYLMEKFIWVMTSNDTLIKTISRKSVEITPLGISLPKEFYQPRYDVDSVRYNQKERDTRATLYWNPRLAFRAGEEKKIFFYTNDKRGTYFVVIEGITREGIPVRRVEKIVLK